MTNDALFRYWLMRVSELTPNQRVEMFPPLNSWEWPKEFDDKKPEGWDSMRLMDRYEIRSYRALMDAIQWTTSHFDRSQAWWKYAIKEKSGNEHYRFYLRAFIEQYRPPQLLMLLEPAEIVSASL